MNILHLSIKLHSKYLFTADLLLLNLVKINPVCKVPTITNLLYDVMALSGNLNI
jgi:hypothetical protein